MSDDTKILDQNPVSGSQIQPQALVGVANKEISPIHSVVSEIMPAGPEIKHEISQELKELGVEEKRDVPDLTFEHRQIGLEHAGPSVPFPTDPSGLVQISEKKDIGNSSTWYNAVMEKVQKVFKLMGV